MSFLDIAGYAHRQQVAHIPGSPADEQGTGRRLMGRIFQIASGLSLLTVAAAWFVHWNGSAYAWLASILGGACEYSHGSTAFARSVDCAMAQPGLMFEALYRGTSVVYVYAIGIIELARIDDMGLWDLFVGTLADFPFVTALYIGAFLFPLITLLRLARSR